MVRTIKAVRLWVQVKEANHRCHYTNKTTSAYKNKKKYLLLQTKEIQIYSNILQKCNLRRSGNQDLNILKKIHKKVTLWVRMFNLTTPWTISEFITKRLVQCKFIKRLMRPLEMLRKNGRNKQMMWKLDRIPFLQIKRSLIVKPLRIKF